MSCARAYENGVHDGFRYGVVVGAIIVSLLWLPAIL